MWALALWPGDPNVVAAGTGEGVFLSRDAGASWARISPEANRELRPVVSLAFHPENRDILYAGTTHLPWRTRDGGARWESIHSGMLDDSDVFSIAVERQSPATVFASACSGVYRSADGGNLWKRLPTPKGAFRTYLVAVDPRRPGVVFAATSAGLLRSSNSGATWTRISPHAVKSIAFDPAVASKIYFASSSGGLLVSRDGGATVLEFNNGFSNRNFTAMAGSGDILYATTIYEPGSGGLFRTDNRGLSWRHMASPGTNENIVRLAVAPDDPNTVYAAGYRTLFESSSGGTSWSPSGPLPTAGAITALLPLPHGALLVGTPVGVFRKTKGGGWTSVRLAGGHPPVELLQRSGGGAIAAVTAAGAQRSEDGGLSWSVCGQPTARTVWYGLAFDAGQSGAALAATSNGMFRSSDRCQSWTPVTGGVDAATVSTVAFHPARPGEAVAAQYGRILRSTDGGRTWTSLGDEGRNGAYPTALLVLPAAPQRLFALFPRRGILSNLIETLAVSTHPSQRPGAGASNIMHESVQ